MRGQSRPRVLTIAFSIVLLSLASLVGGMTANELNVREGCTTEMRITVWQGNVEVMHSCPTVQQPSHPRTLQGTLVPRRCTERPMPRTTTDGKYAGNHPGIESAPGDARSGTAPGAALRCMAWENA